ncbi:N-acetyltransferase [Amylibacter marinus]|uniref:N-acetyltransferase n=1 Tax=Amylibacter marinus TaxID=1475483 RepID=A0ABQ5VWG6_9RHOB|nr:GNAT family N-acetyltransferase [Amylibacter marinus]GLQ35549.1 N-acetyltransferase [Amylibacter marinus]
MADPHQPLFEAIDATWPAAQYLSHEGWLIRRGAGGGKRVSAATLQSDDAQIDAAISAQTSMGQAPLFMIRPTDNALDCALAQRGFEIVDPVVLLAKSLGTTRPTAHSCYPQCTPEMQAIWAAGGIDQPRIDVMQRAAGPKCFTYLTEGAVAFSALHQGICMTHAVEVAPDARRQGLGRRIMQDIECWAQTMGAQRLMVLSVRENRGAMALYQSLNMRQISAYHYRRAPAP